MTSLLSLAIRAALAAGRDIMGIYNGPIEDFQIEHKADNSPLTRADKAAHKCIMSFLEPTGIPVLSEEGAHLPYSTRSNWHHLWIVDPLDGTKEFIKRNGEFTVNIALVEDGVPVIGVIFRPVHLPTQRPTPQPLPLGRGEAGAVLSFQNQAGAVEASQREAATLYFANRGIGAWKADIYEDDIDNIDQIIQTAQPLPSLTGGVGGGSRSGVFVCVASRSHLSPETEAFIEELRRKHPVLELISSGSSLKICLVAEGKADIYPRHAPTIEWDTAAGDAIARAAGCQVVDAQTERPLTYNKEDLHNPWFIVRRT